jgi:cyanophycinase
MCKFSTFALFISLIFFVINPAGAASGKPIGIKTQRGNLILIGGGSKPRIVLRTFVELAGGSNAPIIIIPTASGEPDTGEYYEKLFLEEIGCKNVTALPIKNKEDANREDYVTLVDEAGGCFFSGGDQNKILEAFTDTLVGAAIGRLYWRGQVIGGTSAGTACQSNPMITGEGDFSVIEADNVELKPGLGFFPGIIIDQHFVARKRQNRLISVVLENPEMLGVGIDEATAVWLKPNLDFQVLGTGWVFVYDAKNAKIHRQSPRKGEEQGKKMGVTNLKTHILIPGSKFSLKRRCPIQ